MLRCASRIGKREDPAPDRIDAEVNEVAQLQHLVSHAHGVVVTVVAKAGPLGLGGISSGQDGVPIIGTDRGESRWLEEGRWRATTRESGQ